MSGRAIKIICDARRVGQSEAADLRLRLLKPCATNKFSTMSVLQISIAALPFLLSLARRTSKAIAPCLLASIFAVRERLRAI